MPKFGLLWFWKTSKAKEKLLTIGNDQEVKIFRCEREKSVYEGARMGKRTNVGCIYTHSDSPCVTTMECSLVGSAIPAS